MKKDLQIFCEFVYGVQTEDDLGRVFDDRNRSLNDPRITTQVIIHRATSYCEGKPRDWLCIRRLYEMFF